MGCSSRGEQSTSGPSVWERYILRVGEATMSTVPSFAEFLATCPPGQERVVLDLVRQVPEGGTGRIQMVLDTPDIRIECSSSECDGPRTFMCFRKPDIPLAPDTLSHVFLHYWCRNCTKSS